MEGRNRKKGREEGRGREGEKEGLWRGDVEVWGREGRRGRKRRRGREE